MTRAIALAASIAVTASCNGDATGPLTPDVQMARAAWMSSRPANYSFEISTWNDWFGQSPYYTVTVEDGVGTTVRDESGAEVPSTIIQTIEDHWKRILDADTKGVLQRAKFTLSGVPVDWFIDNEAWADDASGATIRNFQKR